MGEGWGGGLRAASIFLPRLPLTACQILQFGHNIPMELPLLKTKFHIPESRNSQLLRPRLLTLLNAGLNGRLTLLSAPAGFGKTTLLSSWARQCGRPVAWLSLDPRDNDPAHFWTYLLAAIQTATGLPLAAREMLLNRQSPPVETLLSLLLNELSDADTPLLLALDDYHAVENDTIHQGLAFCLDHLPANLHLAVATRTDPPWPLSRLRARRNLTEIRADTLRFTEPEARAFFNQILKNALPPDTLATLIRRTEGWIAGLQMAALSIQGRDDPTDFLENFNGAHRYILDYLLEEVLHREAPPIQQFMLDTAVLERLNGPLCDAVTGHPHSQARLEQLETANLFLLPLDEQRHWYRYHSLYRDFLLEELRRRDPDRIPELHQRAAREFARQGDLEAAVQHALTAGATAAAADYLIAAAPLLLARGEIATLTRWLDSLPPDEIRQRPRLCLHHAVVAIFSGQTVAIAARLHQAENALTTLPESEATPLRGQLALIRAQTAFLQSDLPTAIVQAEQALAWLPETDLIARGSATLLSGSARAFAGDLETAREKLLAARELSRLTQNSSNEILADCSLAQLQLVQGRLHEAAHGFTLLTEELQRRHRQLPDLGYTYIGLAEVYREWNDLEKAAEAAREGLRLCRQWGLNDAVINAHIMLARVELARGNEAAARRLHIEAAPLANALSAWSMIQLEAYQALTDLQSGRLAAAADWARKLPPFDMATLNIYAEKILLIRLQIGLALQEIITPSLTALIDRARAGNHTENLIEGLTLSALVAQEQNLPALAREQLLEALTLAHPGGYIRLFVDKGPALQKLLVGLTLPAGPLQNYVAQIRAAFAPPTPVALIDPLTERETEILHLIAAGLDGPTIAQRIYVSINTVKAHTKSLYAKLGVHSRIAALEKARSLHLL